MVIVIRKRRALTALVLCCLCAGLVRCVLPHRGSTVQTVSSGVSVPVLILDAGHGGEDGGAVAADGTVESGLNLEIAERLRTVLCFLGEVPRMTRRTDVSLHDAQAKTLRQKKASDLRHRAALVNAVPGGVLISIHQNSLPSSPAVRGPQVFWNGTAGAEALAGNVQQRLNLLAEKGREARPISGSIYLMRHIDVPGIIVECGFLSNREETAQLSSPGYQRRLAVAVAAGYLGFLAGEEQMT